MRLAAGMMRRRPSSLLLPVSEVRTTSPLPSRSGRSACSQEEPSFCTVPRFEGSTSILASRLSTGDEAMVDWGRLRLGHVIGSGASGVCYQGTFAGTAVAIKVLHPQSVTEADLAGLVNECRLMLRLRHPHAQRAGVEHSAADARATVSGAWARPVGRTG